MLVWLAELDLLTWVCCGVTVFSMASLRNGDAGDAHAWDFAHCHLE